MKRLSGSIRWAGLAGGDGGVVRKVERAVGLTATAVLVFLHLVLLAHAGGLWRDEANLVNLSSMPPREVWANLEFDSTPLGYVALLRAWIWTGLGATDFSLRILGCLLGLGVLGALWRNALRFGCGVPLVSLALLGFNVAAITHGDAIRGYGLGMLTALLTLGLIWGLVERPSVRTTAIALAFAVVSVHAVFFNAVILLGACAGGTAVALRRRQWNTIRLIAIVGSVSALTLLPYIAVFQSRKAWNFMIQFPISLTWIWARFVEASGLSGPLTHWIWIGLALLGVLAVLAANRPGAPGSPGKPAEVGLFCGVALVTAVSAYLLFVLRLAYPMQPWYFLVLMALVASCLDGALLAVPRQSLRIAVTVVAIAAMTLAIGPVWKSVHVRKTNLDVIAAKLTQSSEKGDVIIVSPWFIGITFDRYYHGAAEWFTIPPMSSHKVHRWDLLKEAMTSSDAMKPVLSRIEKALQSGHRVWVVGTVIIPAEGQGPPVIQPATVAPWGFREEPYYRAWGTQVGYVMSRDGLSRHTILMPSAGLVSHYEGLPLGMVEGRPPADGRAAANVVAPR
jgi:hypothetical protein